MREAVCCKGSSRSNAVMAAAAVAANAAGAEAPWHCAEGSTLSYCGRVAAVVPAPALGCASGAAEACPVRSSSPLAAALAGV